MTPIAKKTRSRELIMNSKKSQMFARLNSRLLAACALVLAGVLATTMVACGGGEVEVQTVVVEREVDALNVGSPGEPRQPESTWITRSRRCTWCSWTERYPGIGRSTFERRSDGRSRKRG